MISISVLFQAIVFITVGSLGDYGDYRKRGLVGVLHLRRRRHAFTSSSQPPTPSIGSVDSSS